MNADCPLCPSLPPSHRALQLEARKVTATAARNGCRCSIQIPDSADFGSPSLPRSLALPPCDGEICREGQREGEEKEKSRDPFLMVFATGVLFQESDKERRKEGKKEGRKERRREGRKEGRREGRKE